MWLTLTEAIKVISRYVLHVAENNCLVGCVLNCFVLPITSVDWILFFTSENTYKTKKKKNFV